MTTARAASLSCFVALTIAGGAAWAGGPARAKPKGFLQAPRQYMREYKQFKEQHGLKPLANADYKAKIKPWKAFRRSRQTGVTPEDLAPAPRMAARMTNLKDRARDIRQTLAGIAGRANRTDTYDVGETVRSAMTQYTGAVSELEEAVEFHGKHKVGSRAELREAATKLRDAMAPQIAIMMGGKDYQPQRFGADMLTGSLAGAMAREGYNADRATALRADARLKSFISSGTFDGD